MLELIFPITLTVVAGWCGFTVLRTAFELRHELAPVREASEHPIIRYRIERARARRLRRAA